MSTLVIVESPTKAKTISKFLGRGYHVLSSYGHVRDLPKSDLGVDVEHGYTPDYEIPVKAKPHVKELKAAAKEADEILFATDEDREGEAISWHLADVLGIDAAKVKRIVFHEITKHAIEEAVAHPRALDEHLVDAQQARRILDRLYGYEISPLLWRKIAPKLSAGRVQSVATRLLVLRERERMAFRKAAYFDILGQFAKSEDTFAARLVEVSSEGGSASGGDGARIATGKQFDPSTGELTAEAKTHGYRHLLANDVEELAKTWQGDTWKVASVEEKPTVSHPAAPFTTSTLQQEAARKLRMSSQETMRTAQSLYEHGYITYMRTDSTTLSEQALNAAREIVAKKYGAASLPKEARQYHTKVKNAQEAHEAIRPAGETFEDPAALRPSLSPAEAALYELIWQRTVASQMRSADLLHTTATITNGQGIFSATGKVVVFPGYLAVYHESEDDGEREGEETLPKLSVGETLDCRSLAPESHETKPPARYTEPTLIKTLEAHGIGRPSTFASILSTIVGRDYVRRDGMALVPTWKAFAVIGLLEKSFTHLVDIGFTAEMENGLDEISLGEKQLVPFLDVFYKGEGKYRGLKEMLGADIDARESCTLPLGESNGVPVAIRVGRYGPYVQQGEQTANIPETIAPADLTLPLALEMLKAGEASKKPLGTDPATGKPIYLLSGRFGPYVQLGEKPEREKGKRVPKELKPKMKSLPKNLAPSAVTLEIAEGLLALPRAIGTFPKNNETIFVDLGRFGPYLKAGEETRSLKKEDDVLTITLERAIELLNEEKKGRGGRRMSKTVLREIVRADGTKLEVLDGRYGPYVTDGKTNASIPKGTDAADLTIETAESLLLARAGVTKKKRQ